MNDTHNGDFGVDVNAVPTADFDGTAMAAAGVLTAAQPAENADGTRGQKGAHSDFFGTHNDEQTEGETSTARESIATYCEGVLRRFAENEDGLTATREETACARAVRDELAPYAPTTRLEAFRTPPYAGRTCCALMAAIYTLAALFYFVSFGGTRWEGIILVLVAIFVLVAGGAFAVGAFLGEPHIVKLIYPKKVSYNVYSESAAAGEKDENLLVIASAHDAAPGSYFANFDLMRRVTFIVVPLSVALFLLFCLVKIFVGSDTVAKITSLTIVPFLTCIAGIAAMLLHFSPFQRHARANNGVSTAVALSVYRHFLAHPERLPKDTRVCFVSFGGENSAHAGSRAFAEQHPEIKGATALVFGDIESASFTFIHRDPLRNINLSHGEDSALAHAVSATGVSCATQSVDGIKPKLNAMHGYSATALAQAGCEALAFVAKDYLADSHEVCANDAADLVLLACETAIATLSGETEDNA